MNNNKGNHFRLGSYMRLLLLKQKLRTIRHKKILDVGCNYGEVAGFLAAGNQVTGIDTDSNALQIAKKTVKNAKFTYGSATNIPFPKESFDVVVCLSVLEHVREDQKVIKEMSRVIKNNGELILTVPNKNANLIPTWLEGGIKLINRLFKTTYPVTGRQYVHFGTEGIGHVRQGYSVEKMNLMLAKEKLTVTSSGSYWHAPSRLGYMLITPLLKSNVIGQWLAKLSFLPFFLLDRVVKDDKGDIYLFAKKSLSDSPAEFLEFPSVRGETESDFEQ